MELAVVPQHLGDVALVDGDHHLVVDVFQLAQHGRLRAPHRAQQLVLEQLAHPVNLGQVLVVEFGHDVAAVDLVGDDALGLECPERLAQRTAGNPDALRQLDLQDFLAGKQHAVDDETADLRGGLQRQL